MTMLKPYWVLSLARCQANLLRGPFLSTRCYNKHIQSLEEGESDDY